MDLTRGTDSCRRSRGIHLHQGEKSVSLRLLRRNADEHPSQSQRLIAQGRADPVFAARRRIAFVEDQINDFEHRGEPRAQLAAARSLVDEP